MTYRWSVCLFFTGLSLSCHSSVCSTHGRSSIISSVAGPSTRPLLVCHWSVCSTHLSLMLGSACLCITDPSARLPLLCWSITGPSLVHHWSITALSVRPLLSCHSSVCSSVAGPSTGVVVTGPSLVCLLLHRSSACTSPLVCRWSVADPWLIWLLESWSLVRGSYITRPSTRVVSVLSLGSTRHCFTSVRLFDSTLRSS